MKHTALASLVLGFQCTVAFGQQPDAVATLTSELRSHAPEHWEIRVRWRDGQLLASLTPWPYQKAFELWYDQPRLIETLRNLCPAATDPIWQQIQPTQDVILEPTVGGKAGVEARVSCRKVVGA